MPNIILKKTFKNKPQGYSIKNEKTFSFHGGISPEIINLVNRRVGMLRLAPGADRLYFQMDSFGHYSAKMNHDFQKHHEEDAVVTILDVMEEINYAFKFQYDQEVHSSQAKGASYTRREMFIFSKA